MLEHDAVRDVEAVLPWTTYEEERGERMSTMKKTAPTATAEHEHPREAYEWEDDVTDEGIEKVKERARQRLPKGKLELIDGFGRYTDA